MSCKDGKKLHQNAADLQRHRQVNDEICMAHGLQVLEPPKKHTRKKQMRPGEYQAGLRGDSWKLDLIQAINDALEYADDRESFVENMEYEGNISPLSVLTVGGAGTAASTMKHF